MWIEKLSLALTFIVIIAIIVFQIRSYRENKKKMKEFETIFINGSWSLIKDPETRQIIGIEGKGNSTFNAIKKAINKYLKCNAGGIIDYALLRETVERNCDSLEEEISSQIPVPLYCGLCGTMLGVIIGLGSLLISGSITTLLEGDAPTEKIEEVKDVASAEKSAANDEEKSTSIEKNAANKTEIKSAAEGVNSLLIGVAFAMVASLSGIFLTIRNTNILKKSKQQEESGKNAFLTWMQAYLLPVLPTNMSNALTEMSRNLNRFNETFSKNVVQLDGTLSKVNEVYLNQQDVISKVCQMDPMRMAEANVKTLRELENCLAKFPIFSDQVEKFSQYLVKIDEFTEKLNKEIYRLDILEGIKDSMNEIKEFYGRHKGEIERDVVDSGNKLNEALREFRNTSKTSIGKLQNVLIAQTSELSNVIKEEKNIVVNIAQDMKIKFINEVDTMKKQAQKLLNDMQDEFQEQLDKLPIQEELRQISSIPAKIDETTRRMENTNTTLISEVKTCIEGMTSCIDKLKLNTSLSQIADEIKNGNEKIESELKKISAKEKEQQQGGRHRNINTDPTPDPQPEPVSDPQPEPVPDPQPEPVPDPQPEPVPAPQPEPVPDPQPEPEKKRWWKFW